MNNRQNDSQISAWFDNELTPPERAEVEQRLELSSEAREELAEVEVVSNWISELPPEGLPRDFANRIVASITENAAAVSTQEPVLLAAEPANTAGPMRWTRGLGVLISAAAVLVVAVTLMNGPATMNSPFDSSVADVERSELPLHADGLDRLQAEGGAGASYALHPEAANKAGANRKNADRIEKQMPIAMSRARDAMPGEFKFDVDLNRVVIGQDVDARVRSGGQVAVVRLTVVDRVEGLKNLQVLLTGKPISRDGAGVRADRSGDAAAAAKPAEAKLDGDDYLVAVYVEASEQQLSAVFDKIRNDSQFQSLRVDRPISAEQLALATTEQLRENGRMISPKPNAALQAAPPRPTRLKAEPEKSREENPSRSSENNPKKQKLAKKFGNATKDGNEQAPADRYERRVQDELVRVSRQLQIRLPREMLLSRIQPAAPAADRPADDVADKRAGSRREKPGAEKAKLAESRAADRPLQVIFVLDVASERGEH